MKFRSDHFGRLAHSYRKTLDLGAERRYYEQADDKTYLRGVSRIYESIVLLIWTQVQDAVSNVVSGQRKNEA